MKAKLGRIEIDLVRDEQPLRSNEITDKPVESGPNIVDHIKPLPERMTINAVLAGDGWQDKWEVIKEYVNKGTVLIYRGRETMLPVVIESLPSVADRFTADGIRFTAVLKRLRFAVSQTETLQKPDPVTPSPPAGTKAVETQTKELTPARRVQIREDLRATGQQIENALIPPIRDIYGPSVATLVANADALRARQEAMSRMPGGR